MNTSPFPRAFTRRPRLWLLVLACACFPLAAPAQVIVTVFGNSAFVDGTWTYNPSTSTISGVESVGNSIYGLSQSLDLGAPIALALTGTATTAPAGSFTATIEDNTGKVATALYFWSTFVGGATRTEPFNFVETGFNFSNVLGWSLDSGGSTQAVNASFSRLSAVPVPEPAVLFLLWAGLIAAWAAPRYFAGSIPRVVVCSRTSALDR